MKLFKVRLGNYRARGLNATVLQIEDIASGVKAEELKEYRRNLDALAVGESMDFIYHPRHSEACVCTGIMRLQ